MGTRLNAKINRILAQVGNLSFVFSFAMEISGNFGHLNIQEKEITDSDEESLPLHALACMLQLTCILRLNDVNPNLT